MNNDNLTALRKRRLAYFEGQLPPVPPPCQDAEPQTEDNDSADESAEDGSQGNGDAEANAPNNNDGDTEANAPNNNENQNAEEDAYNENNYAC